jgi:hypothetical protein
MLKRQAGFIPPVFFLAGVEFVLQDQIQDKSRATLSNRYYLKKGELIYDVLLLIKLVCLRGHDEIILM